MPAPGNRQQKRRSFYPSLLLVLLLSHFVYYFAVFNGTYTAGIPFVLLAMLCATAGYAVGYRVRFVFKRSRAKQQAPVYKYAQLRTVGLVFLAIGILSHLYYYSSVSLTDYASGYAASRGQGYVTVFFNFWVLGMVVLEYLSCEGLNKGFLKWGNRLLIVVYAVFYFFVLYKRRQIITLFLALFAIWGRRMKTSQKTAMYVFGAASAFLFMIFGQIRGYMDSHSLLETIRETIKNFSYDWISLENFEGKYMSRMLDEVYHHVRIYGHDPSILLGVLFCMVPRKLLGGIKPLAFPEWYTKTFHPTLYAKGIGYAGSFVAELYLIAGIPMVILGYFVVGYVCARIQKGNSHTNDFRKIMVYSLFVYTILLLPRYDLASLFIDVVFLYLPLIFLCKGNYTH